MKKILCILLAVSCLLSLAACQLDRLSPRETESAGTAAPSETGKDATSAPTQPTQSQPTAALPALLTVEKSLFSYYEWAEDSDMTLVRSEHSCVTLSPESAGQYPAMAEVLSSIAAMQEKAMLEEFDNLVSIAKDRYRADPSGFETCVSTLEVKVRRADSAVVSLLTDSYSHYGQIQNYRVFHGSNYDPETGELLSLDDVVKFINNDLAIAVEKELTAHMWTGDFHSQYAVQEYFADTPYDSFNWTLDYNGVTFYFDPGLLCDGGSMSATVSFAEYPEFFYEKYMTVPATYATELPLDISFFTDLDLDGALDALSVSGWYDTERLRYMDFGVYTDIDDRYCYQECFVSHLHPYYVQTETGPYLYLFCEDFEEGWRQMELVVIRFDAEGVTVCGQWELSPEWVADNRFVVPNDPNSIPLNLRDAGIG